MIDIVAWQDACRQGPAYYTANEVAEMLSVHPNTVYAMARRGELPSVKFGKRLVKFEKAAIDGLVGDARRKVAQPLVSPEAVAAALLAALSSGDWTVELKISRR